MTKKFKVVIPDADPDDERPDEGKTLDKIGAKIICLRCRTEEELMEATKDADAVLVTNRNIMSIRILAYDPYVDKSLAGEYGVVLLRGDLSELLGQSDYISTTDTVPIIRVAWNDVALIKRAMDIGAYGVVVPMVSTRGDAIRAVRFSKYPPEGMRGIGGMRRLLYGGPTISPTPTRR